MHLATFPFVVLSLWACSRGAHACYYTDGFGHCTICLSCQLNSGAGGTFASQQACSDYVASDLGSLPVLTSNPTAAALYSASLTAYSADDGACNFVVSTCRPR